LSTLVLVRHGQASFFEDDYDRLSELGQRQSRRLARSWQERGLRFDAAYTGPLERQRATAAEVLEALGGAPVELPVPQVMSEWSEYDGALLTDAWAREMADRQPDLIDAPRMTPEQRAAHAKSFQKAFERLMREWVAGERVVEGAETWQQFKERVVRGLQQVVAAHPSGSRVVVFSSGGAIAVAVGHVLGLGDPAILELNWTARNCAVSEVLYSRDRMSLSSYNCTAHLEPELLTYR
jgi:broad specificity phosphatase PhoE